jgi:hypothetical protein
LTQLLPGELPHHGFSPTIDDSLSLWRNLNKFDENCQIETFEVSTCALDDLLETEPSIDIIKMDIEGAEVFAFRGMKKILEQGKTRIYIETHSAAIEAMCPGGMEEISATVKQCGYTIYQTKGLLLKAVDSLVWGRYYLSPPDMEP